MEVQSHGVLFEDNIVRAITGVSKDEYQTELPNGYTASMDVVKGIKSNANYSIKVSKHGKSIGCGDILRIVEHCKNNEFTMVVGAWQQISPTVKRYDCIYEFDIRPENYEKLWSGITQDALESFVKYVKEIPHGPEGQGLHKKLWKQKRQEIYDTHGRGLFKIDAKIDSKNQRRVQCSIKIKDLIETKEITHRKYETEYKGIPLPYEQQSGPRQFS